MDRVILHCDCNCFYASVEMVAHPEYRNVPMAVCGSKEARHGIVLTKNDFAKKCGVETGEVIWQAKKKCPTLVTVEPHFSLYEQYSREANRIYADYTDMIEPFGIDESWLDVTGSSNLFGDGKKIAEEIRKRIKSELGITVSIGVSFNKTFAKLGSDYKKPDAVTVITRDNFKKILYPLPVGDMMYIGKHTVPKLRMMGINTIGELANADLSVISEAFGKTGKNLYEICNGKDESTVAKTIPLPKSYGNGMTFLRDLCGENDFRAAVAYLSDKAASRMRAGKARCRVVSVAIRDTSLSVINRRQKLFAPSSATSIIEETANRLVFANWDVSIPVRSIQVACCELIDEYQSEQLKFSYTEEEIRTMRFEALDHAADKVRSKFGNGILRRGCLVNTSLGV